MTDLASPRASRLATPRWLDARLVLGVLLVLVAVVAGARVFAAADRFTRVYVAAHDLVPGERVSRDDLGVGRVRLSDAADRYIAADRSRPLGYLVTRYVAAGELVPLHALATSAAAAQTRLVTVPVQPGHLPADLGHGDVVDVYVTAKVAAGAAVPPPTLVLAAATVDARDGGTRAFTGTSTVAVVLSVPVARVRNVVHAVQSGAIDLVRVPTAAVASAPSPAASS